MARVEGTHSNKKMPTWKGLLEGSRLSKVDEADFKESSLDRVNSKKMIGNGVGVNNSVAQSRHELL
jgi:hypothetical protein